MPKPARPHPAPSRPAHARTGHARTGSSRPESEVGCPRPSGCERYESPVIRKVFQLHHMMMRVGDRLAAPHGLTGSRWMLLCAMGRADEPQTVAAISEEILLSPQNVSRMVVSMEEDGLVTRFNLPGAGRSTFVALTDEGWRAYGVTRELAERFLGPFLEGFSGPRTDRLDRDLTALIENTRRLEDSLLHEAERSAS